MSIVAARAFAPRQRGEGTRIDPRTHLGEGRRKLPLTPTLSPLPRGEGAHRVRGLRRDMPHTRAVPRSPPRVLLLCVSIAAESLAAVRLCRLYGCFGLTAKSESNPFIVANPPTALHWMILLKVGCA